MQRLGLGILLQIIVIQILGGRVVTAMAEGVSSAVPVWDGVSKFDKSNVHNAMDGSVRESGRAGGVIRRSIFLHPVNEEDATLDYEVELPKVGQDERLMFSTHLALSDGIKLNEPEHPIDGAGFAVEIDGTRLLHEVVKET
ncbi:MAG: hypothetical protein HY318_16420, partial [Armatimonadetes bacterium]|nr:hypothetical protein [Armatimonadota bacterium]